MNAAFGGVSAGGLGAPLFDVTQSGGGPRAFVANHCIGIAGGVTPSKFSTEVIRPAHGGQRLGLERIPATIGPLAMEPAISSTNKIKFRSRGDVNMCFRFLVIAGEVRETLYHYPHRAVKVFLCHAVTAFSSANKSEERVRSSAVILLMLGDSEVVNPRRLVGRHEMMVAARDKKLEAARETRKLKRQQQLAFIA